LLALRRASLPPSSRRKPPPFHARRAKKKAKSAQAAGSRLGNVSGETIAKRPGNFAGNELEAQSKTYFGKYCGGGNATAEALLNRSLVNGAHCPCEARHAANHYTFPRPLLECHDQRRLMAVKKSRSHPGTQSP
jgi:hypothetical protein